MTFSEVLIVMLLLAVVAAVGSASNPSSLEGDAADVANHLRRERMAQIVASEPVRVGSCLMSVGDAVNADVISWPPRGLQFTPDGLPRTCDGGGVGNTTILLAYRGQQAAVIVSSLGRVRWEMR